MPNTLQTAQLNQLLEYQIKSLQDTQKVLEARIASLEEERNRAMRWGITTLGAAALAMGSWMFNFVMGHYK